VKTPTKAENLQHDVASRFVGENTNKGGNVASRFVGENTNKGGMFKLFND
jgi:hypothetical protein